MFYRTSKEINVERHTPEHIQRWEWIGSEVKSYKELSAPIPSIEILSRNKKTIEVTLL